jgi:hypothetical protein
LVTAVLARQSLPFAPTTHTDQRTSGLLRGHMFQTEHNVADRTDKRRAVVYNAGMPRLPNQISSDRLDLLVQIEKCRRLAKASSDSTTVERLLALAAEYELQLHQIQHG